MNRTCYYLVLALIAGVTSLHAQERTWDMQTKLAIEEPTSPVISPNGAYVAFTIRKPNLVASKWHTQIYAVPTAGRPVRQMTASTASCYAPGWSPDGTLLTFVSSREYLNADMQPQRGAPQLFALPIDGGEARNLTQLENGVDEYVWSKDGNSIAILSAANFSKEDAALLQERAAKKIDAISTSDPKNLKEIWLYNVAENTCEKLKTVDRGVTNMDWSPDGSCIVFQTNYTGEYNDDQKYDIWTIGVTGSKRGVLTQLTSEAGPETMPKYSPDGKYIVYKTQTVPDIEFAELDCAIMSADGSNKKSLTQYFDYSVDEYVWRPDSKALVLLTAERTFNMLYIVPLDGGKWRPVTFDSYVTGNLSTAKDGMLAYTISGPDMVREIQTCYNSAPDALQPERSTLTSFTKQLNGLPLGKQEVITVKSSDGKFDIEAVLTYPVNYKKGTRYPLLLAYHGGPYGRFENKRIQYYPSNILAERGVMTVMPNVRGSSGYTDAFSQANRYDLGGGDYQDAMDIVNALIAQGLVDSTRMGVMGGSYGGYMTNWTISQTQRFSAAISLYGIFS